MRGWLENTDVKQERSQVVDRRAIMQEEKKEKKSNVTENIGRFDCCQKK